MADNRVDGKVVLIPCNGLSARGRVAHLAAIMVEEGMPEVQWVDCVPLMAEVDEEVKRVREARYVMGLAGCAYRCDALACRRGRGRETDDAVVIGKIVPPHIAEAADLSEDDKKRFALETASQVIAKLNKL